MFVLHSQVYIIELLKLSPDHIFYYLWPAVVAKKSVEFFSNADSHVFKISLLVYEKKLFFKA